MKPCLSYLFTSLLAAVLCIAPATAAAEDVTVAFTVDLLTVITDESGVLGDLDDTKELNGIYKFDKDAPDGVPEDWLGSYWFDVGPYGITFTYESEDGETNLTFDSVEGGRLWIEVMNNVEEYPGDIADIIELEIRGVSLNGVACDDTDGGIIQMGFIGSDDVLEDDSLPESALDLNDWPMREFFARCHSAPTYFNILGDVIFAEEVVQDPLDTLLTLLNEVSDDNNGLDAEQEAGLQAKIQQVAVKLGSNRAYQACQQLEAFICQLEALADQFTPVVVDGETITVEDLLDLAYQIQEDNNCQEVQCVMAE
jgi:hypothetical protein